MTALAFMTALAAAIKEKGHDFELYAHTDDGSLAPVTGLDTSVALRGDDWKENTYVDTRVFSEPE